MFVFSQAILPPHATFFSVRTSVVPIITDLHRGQFMLKPCFCTSDLLIYNLLAARSTCDRRHHDLRDWCVCWHRECHINGKCIGYHLSRRRIRVPLRTVQCREELEMPTLQLWASPNILRSVPSTWRHDQHLITAVSDTDECSILPLGILFYAYLAPPGRLGMKYIRSPEFNQLSTVPLASMQFVSCAPLTTSLVP